MVGGSTTIILYNHNYTQIDQAVRYLWPLISIVFWSQFLFAQDWSAPGYFNHYIFSLETDNSGEHLLIQGLSKSIDNSINIQGLAKYDGMNFSTINGNVMEPPDFSLIPQQSRLKFFNGKLFFYGKGSGLDALPTMEGDTVGNNYLIFENGQWNKWETEWDDGAQWNNRLTCMEVIDDELWLIPRKQNYYDSFRWARAQLDGSINYFEIQASENPVVGEIQGYFGKIVKWGNDYYLLGKFITVNPNGTSSQVHILKWDGENSFEYLPPAFFYGLSTSPFDMVVYGDKLVVAGYFSESISGSPSNFIMTWDGEQWAPLFGNGTNGTVQSLKVINDLLFLAGNFGVLYRDDGEYPASCVAYYDGSQAYRLSDEVIVGVITDLEVFQNKLYIAGHITSIQLQPYGGIARFEGELPTISHVDESTFVEKSLTVYPNPCRDLCYLELPSGHNGGQLQVFDVGGRLVSTEHVPRDTYTWEVFRISGEANGLYYLNFQEEGGNYYSTKCLMQ